MHTADVRIVAATNADLEDLVRKNRFREDLYYRLTVVPIRMPSLSERRDDIALLAEQFVDASTRRNHFPMLKLSPSARLALELAPWPGNVRELQNTVERGVLQANAQGLEMIETRHFFRNSPGDLPSTRPLSFQEATLLFHRSLLAQTLEATGWNITEAADQLDVARSHLYNLLRTTGLTRNGG